MPDAWLEEIRDWASQEEYVAAAYLFGSRAKGTARDDSDIDVAILLSGSDDGERVANWIAEAARMKSSLSSRFSIKVDLQPINDGDEIVGPAVEEHGVLIFERGSNQ